MNETLPINRGKREFSLQLLNCSTEALSAIDQVGKEIWQESLQFSQHIVPGRQFGHERSQVAIPVPARLCLQLGCEEIVQRVVRHSAMSALAPEQIAQIDVL